MDESRKAFESWLMEEFGYRHDYLEYWRGEGDYKSHPDLRSRWQGWSSAWTASRSAIEIELPPAVDGSNVPFAGNAWNAYRVEAVKAIRASGIKVKE
ncbi:TPA: hypothetical protein ACJIWE_000697 [Enterobacter roggenkampii]